MDQPQESNLYEQQSQISTMTTIEKARIASTRGRMSVLFPEAELG